MKQRGKEQRGFPTRQVDTVRKAPITLGMSTRPKELKYDLAERMKSRTLKTHNYENGEKDNDTSYKEKIRLRKKKIILEDSDGSDDDRDYDDQEQRTRKDLTNATRNNTQISTTNYLTAATGNRNTVMRTQRSRISSRGSEED